MEVMARRSEAEELRCSFCHKSQSVVVKLISSPSDYPRAYICDECIVVCNSILQDDSPGSFPQGHPLTPQLFEALRQWLGDDSQTTRVRSLAEQIIGEAQWGKALETPAGAELDELLAAKMGEVAHYSTDLQAAWR